MGSAFTVEDNYGGLIPNYSRYVSFTSAKTNLSWLNDVDKAIDYQEIPLSKCNRKNFQPGADIQIDYDFDVLESAFCINQTQNIGGFQDIAYNIFYTVTMKRCKNESTDTNGAVCAPVEEINSFLQRTDIQMTVYYEEIVFSPYNYSTPVTYYITEDFFGISPLFCEVNEFFIQNFVVITDKGWLIPQEYNQTYQKIDWKKNFFYYTNDLYSDCLIKTNFYTSEYVTINYRSYAKLPVILAQLGGLLKVIYSFFDFFLIFLYRRMMNEKVIGSLFKITNNDLEAEDAKLIKQKLLKKKTMKRGLKRGQTKVEKEKKLNLDESGEKSKDRINNEEVMKEEEEEIQVITDVVPKDHESLLKNAIENFKKELKKEENEENIFQITMLEHFISMICPVMAGALLRKKLNIYNILSDYSVEYTDVLGLTEVKSEIEKFKYVFLNPKQLAMFNLIVPPENPVKKAEIKNRVSILYRYSKDKKAQIKQAEKFLEEIHSKAKTKLDYKILELLA
jgi:hypothetical protein